MTRTGSEAPLHSSSRSLGPYRHTLNANYPERNVETAVEYVLVETGMVVLVILLLVLGRGLRCSSTAWTVEKDNTRNRGPDRLKKKKKHLSPVSSSSRPTVTLLLSTLILTSA